MFLVYYCSTQSSRPEAFCKKGALKHFAKFIEKQLCRSLSFYKIACWLEKKFRHKCFPKLFFKRTPPEGWSWIWSIFKQFFTRIPKTFGTFWERFIFEIIRLFLLLMPGFRKPWSQGMLTSLIAGRNSDYIYKLFIQASKRKLKNFAEVILPKAQWFVKTVSFRCFTKN